MLHSAKTTRLDNNLIQEQVNFISKQRLPSVMEITQASEFDTPFVQTENDRWEFIRLGQKHILIFDLDEYRNKLLKSLSVMYAESHMSPLGKNSFNIVKKILKESDEISFNAFRAYLERKAKADKSTGYFEVKAITKYLIRIGFPNFDIDDEEELVRVAIPNVTDPFLRYQEVEDTMPTHLKNLIANRLVEFGTEEGLQSLSNKELKNPVF